MHMRPAGHAGTHAPVCDVSSIPLSVHLSRLNQAAMLHTQCIRWSVSPLPLCIGISHTPLLTGLPHTSSSADAASRAPANRTSASLHHAILGETPLHAYSTTTAARSDSFAAAGWFCLLARIRLVRNLVCSMLTNCFNARDTSLGQQLASGPEQACANQHEARTFQETFDVYNDSKSMVVDRMVPCAGTRMFSGGKQKIGLEKRRMPLQMTKINELSFNVLEIAELRRRITYPCRLGCNQCSYRNAQYILRYSSLWMCVCITAA